MASIEVRTFKDGKKTYQVKIRRKGIEIYKSFKEKEDAEIYAYYKEKLIDNMKQFDIELKDRIRLSDIFDLKISSIDSINKREIYDFKNSLIRFDDFKSKFYHEISFEDWLECAKKMLNSDVYRGYKTEISKRKMSLYTLRKIFAHASSCISYANKKGIVLENHPLKVIQCFINKMKN